MKSIEKRKIFGTILGIVIYSALIVAVTFARYVWQSEDTLLTFNFTDEYFYCESGIETDVSSLSPVLDYREGAVQVFGVNNIGRSDTTFSLSLNITEIDSALVSESFKYKLVADTTNGNNNCITSSSCTEVAEGDFSKAKVGMNTLVESISLPNNVRYQYYLFMYIDGNMENSTDMQSATMTSILDVCEVVAFLDYNYDSDCGAPTNQYLKVTSDYSALPTPIRNNSVISFNSNGGSSASSQTIKYTFGGWFSDDTLKTQITTSTPVSSTTNHTLYAKWTPSGTVTLPTVTRTGYTFNGWYSDSGLTNKVGDAGDSYAPGCTTTLYAKWVDKEAPTVTLGSNGDSTYSKTKNVTVTLKDTGSGLAAGSFKYGWSTSNSVEPSSYTTLSTSATTGSATTTFTASGSGFTGDYYLWVVPITYKAKAGNSNTEIVKSTGTFKFDNKGPTITFGTNGNSTYAKSVSSTITVTNDSYGAGLDTSSYKYIYSTSNTATPSTAFTSGSSYSQTSVTGTYYLRAIACDSLGNCTTVTSNAFYLDNTAPSTPTIKTIYDIWGSRSYGISSGYDSDAGTSGTWTTATGDPYIFFNDLADYEGITGGYVEFEEALSTDITIQMFYATNSNDYSGSYYTNKTLPAGEKKLVIPFSHEGEWTKVRFDIGTASGLSYKIKTLGIIADANQWNIDDTYLQLSTTENHSGVNYWQYSYSSSANTIGTDATSTWVSYSSSALSLFVTTAFTEQGNKTVYVRSCDKAGNCSSKSSTSIMIDKTAPSTPSITTIYDIWGSRNYSVSGFSSDVGTNGTWTTSTNDPIIDFGSSVSDISGITGAYIELESAPSKNMAIQIFYATSSGSYNETNSTKATFTTSQTKLVIPFTDTSQTWAKVRFDIGGESGLSYKIKSLGLIGTANQWNRDDIYLQLSTTESHSGVDYWQYSYSSSASTTGTDATSNWVNYSSSSSTTFVTTEFSTERNQSVYIRSCDKVGNCGSKSSTSIKIDKTVPTASISSTTTVKATSQTATLSCTDSNGILSYYWGTSAPTTSSTYTSGTPTTKTVSSDGTNYLVCKDVAGNTDTTSKVYYNYTVKNMLLNITGTAGTYTTSNYTQASSYNYIIPSGSSVSRSGSVTTPTGGTYVGTSQGAPSTTAATLLSSTPTVSANNTVYAAWFNRNEYTVTVTANTGGINKVTNQRGTSVTASSGGSTTMSVRYGETITATATPNSGYKFSGFSGLSTSATSPVTTSGITADSTITAKFTAYKIYVKFNVNGGEVQETTTASDGTVYTWTTDDDGVVYKSTNGGTATAILHTYNYGATMGTNGLANYNNSAYLNIARTGYSVVSDAQWICISGDCEKDKTFSHSTAYEVSELCDASAGNCTAVLGVNWIDNIAPTAPTYTASYNDGSGSYTSGTWATKQVNTAISSTDAGSGVAKIQYSTDKSSWSTFGFSVSALTQSGTTWSGTEPWTLKDRNDTYYFRACDVAGNCSGASTAFNIRYDTSAPDVPKYTAFYADESGNYTSGTWTNKQVYTEITSKDSYSGVSHIQYSKDKSTWSTFNFAISSGLQIDGTTAKGTESWGFYNERNDTYYFRACDNVGNCSSSSTSYNIKYDTEVPGTSITVSAQNATLKCTDNIGVVSYYWGTNAPSSSTAYTSITSTTSMSVDKTISSAGTYYLSCKDAAGNEANSSETIKNYTVTYYNGDTKLGTSSHTYGVAKALTTWSNLSGTIKNSSAGWSFAGWSTSNANTTRTYSDGQSVSDLTATANGNVNLYAVYKRTITFNHGSSNASSSTATQYWNPYGTTDGTHIAEVTSPSLTAITGWTSSGFRNDTTAGAKEYDAGKTIYPAVAEAATLYGIYTRDVTFYSGGGGEKTATVTQYYNSNGSYSVTTPSSITSITNWTTLGWRPDTTATTAATSAGSASTSSASSFYAVYSRTLTFYSGVSKATTDGTRTQYYNSGGVASSVTPYTPVSLSNWTTLGYRTDTSASTASHDYDITNISPAYTTGNSLYAVYSKTWTFYSGSNKVTTDGTRTQYYNTDGATSSITTYTPATITDWTALGYRDDTTAGAKEYSSATSVTPAYSSATSMYAVYSRTATFYSGSNKASSATATQYYTTNNTYSVTTPSSITDISGFTELGWRPDKTASTAATSAGSASTSSSSTFYAVYSRTATFYSGASKASSATATQYYTSNDSYSVTTPSSITAITNWTTLGWRSDTTASTASTSAGSASTSNSSTFYAVYSRTLTVSYNANGGSGTTTASTKTIYLNSNSTTTSSQSVTLASNGFSKSGAAFYKWAAGSASGTQYAAGASYNPSVAYNATTFGKTMYAVWVANMTVTYKSANYFYNTAGGKIDSDEFDYGTRVDATATYSLKDGVFTITGTRSTGDCHANVTAFAYLYAGTTYTFTATTSGTWNTAEGSNGSASGDYVEAYLALNGSTDNGWIWLGGTNYSFIPETTGLYQLRLDVNAYGKTHTFSNLKITTTVGTATVSYGGTYGTMPTPTKRDHVLNGWYTAESGGTKVTSSTTVTATSNHTLYAQDTPKRAVITYAVNGGTVTSSTTNAAGNETYKWTTSSGVVYRSINSGTASNVLGGILYSDNIHSTGLSDYNNVNALNITRSGYIGVSGAEWICLSGCTTSGKTFSQASGTNYKASDFCDASNGTCTVVLGVNWTSQVRKTAAINGNRYCYKAGGYTLGSTNMCYYPTSGEPTCYTTSQSGYSTMVGNYLLGICKTSAYVYTDSSGNYISTYTSSTYSTTWIKVYIASSNVSTSSSYFPVTSVTDTITVGSTKYYAAWLKKSDSMFTSIS